MLIHQLATDAHISQAQAWQTRHILAFVIDPSGNQVDDLHLSRFKRSGLEQLFLARLDCPGLQLALDNLQTFVDFFLYRAGAIAAEHELDNIGGNRKLPTKCAD